MSLIRPLCVKNNQIWGNFTKITSLNSGRFYCNASKSNEVQIQKLTDKYEGITIIGLNRPEAKNAFSRSLVNSLHSTITNLAHDDKIRVVIFRSLVPGIFCAGADLKERKGFTPNEVNQFVSSLRSLLIRIEQLPIPTIAAINGAALGGGLELALACDIRTATENSKLGLVETRLAIIPGAGGTQRLPRIVGPALAKELIFTARVLNGKEAKNLGIINHVCCPQNENKNPDEDPAYLKALQIAEEIIPNGPIGVRMAKVAIDKGKEVDIASGYAIEEACYAQVIHTKDRLEGLKAFAEKRKPKYKGE